MRLATWPRSTITWTGIIRRQGRPICWNRSRGDSYGSYPTELLDLGIQEYREVLCHPYRIIYRMLGQNVYVLVIADGRRDMQTLLQRRLLQA